MEGEIYMFMMVWLSALASLCYCYAIGKIIPKGVTRLFAIFPVILIFLILPLNLHSINFVGPTSFFLVWLANFKLLLFAFGKGPLSIYPLLSLRSFIAVACFPIKIQHHPSPPNLKKTPQKSFKSPPKNSVKFLLLSAFLLIYNNKEKFHPDVMLFMYCIYLYLSLELTLVLGGALARTLIGVELEPQFQEPYLSTSLQDFWGRRWNLIVSDILRPTVYNPIRIISSRLIGTKWAQVPAVLATFFVSGLMHELLFYYFGRAKPRWDVTCFFLLHGVCLVIEMVVKRALKDKWRLPRVLAGPLVVVCVAVTGSRLFVPALLRNEVDVKALREYIAFIEFVNIGREFRHILNV